MCLGLVAVLVVVPDNKLHVPAPALQVKVTTAIVLIVVVVKMDREEEVEPVQLAEPADQVPTKVGMVA